MNKSALIMVDMQNDFMQGGSLAVPKSDEILLNVNKLLNSFSLIVATKDWHPPNHSSFARNVGVKPFETYEGQIKWPDHCIAGTWGSDFNKYLNIRRVKAVFHKGLDENVESYSGFEDENGHESGLTSYLINNKIDNVYVCGLALDYCVKHTAFHASQFFETFIVSDATRAVNPNFIFEPADSDIELITTEQALGR